MPTAPPPAPARGPVLRPADSWAGHHHHPPFPPGAPGATPPKTCGCTSQLSEPARQLHFPQSFFRRCIPGEGLPSTAVAAVTSRALLVAPPVVRRQIRESDLLTTKQKHPKSDLRSTHHQKNIGQNINLLEVLMVYLTHRLCDSCCSC